MHFHHFLFIFEHTISEEKYNESDGFVKSHFVYTIFVSINYIQLLLKPIQFSKFLIEFVKLVA